MPDQIEVRYSVSVQIAGGPTLSHVDNIYTNAYQCIVVHLDKKDNATAMQDVNLPAKIDFLALKASHYGDDVTYSTNHSTTNNTKLTAPLVLIGMNAVERFIGSGASGSGPTRLSFANNSDEAVTIEIVVTHNAIEAVSTLSSIGSTPTSSTPASSTKKASSPKSKSGDTSPENQPIEGLSPEGTPTTG